MKTSRRILAIGITLVLMAAIVPAAFALPPLPSSFYGTVKLNGANVPLGTSVTAWINGVKYVETTVSTMFNGDTVYSLNVPGDDPATPGIIEGGVSGNMIVFRLGAQTTVDQTAPWQSGVNVELSLSANPTAVTVQGLSARNSGGIGKAPGALLAAIAVGLGSLGAVVFAARSMRRTRA